MEIRFFFIPGKDPDSANEELNRYLKQRRVIDIETHFADAAWYLRVSSVSAEEKQGDARRAKTDYWEMLSPEDRAKYSALRTWRKKVAEEKSVQVYTVLTNAQMAHIAQQRPKTISELKKTPQFGEKRIENYGDAILEVVGTHDNEKSD